MKLIISIILILFDFEGLAQVKGRWTDNGYVIPLNKTIYICLRNTDTLIRLFPTTKTNTIQTSNKVVTNQNNNIEASQSLTKDDNLFLSRTIDTFLNYRDVIIADRKTEVSILLLEMDSSGTISNIHVLSDEKRRGNTYLLLCRLNPSIFHKRVFKNCADRLIALPVITTTDRDTTPSYTNKNWTNFTGIRKESDIILAKSIYYQMPEYACEGTVIKATGSYIESSKKKD